jgi:hypothetical protein
MLRVNPQTGTINLNGHIITRKDATEIQNAFWLHDQSETMRRVKEQQMGRKLQKREVETHERYGG